MIKNPLTGRNIAVNGKLYRKLVRQGIIIPREYHNRREQRGGGSDGSDGNGDGNFFTNLLEKQQKKSPVTVISDSHQDTLVVPDSKYHLLNSNLPPNPSEHSWYHSSAPVSQNFGDYICLKRSTLRDLGTFMRDAFSADLNAGAVGVSP